jgi:hypothetical protein
MKWYVIVGDGCATFETLVEAQQFIARRIHEGTPLSHFVVIHGRRFLITVEPTLKEWEP